MSQLVISEATLKCWANQISKSEIGKIMLDNKSLNLFSGTKN